MRNLKKKQAARNSLKDTKNKLLPEGKVGRIFEKCEGD